MWMNTHVQRQITWRKSLVVIAQGLEGVKFVFSYTVPNLPMTHREPDAVRVSGDEGPHENLRNVGPSPFGCIFVFFTSRFLYEFKWGFNCVEFVCPLCALLMLGPFGRLFQQRHQVKFTWRKCFRTTRHIHGYNK